ncbi:late embryogenesis abundant protein At1g64065 [Rosa chinensis]|nr:late embryogenesis abundant protein At1g64065 [Rosa chinensis]
MEDEESQVWVSTPGKLRNERNEENSMFKALRRERTDKSFLFIFFGILVVCIAVLLVVALFVLRVKTPEVKLRSVKMKSLKYSFWPPSFNTTLSAQMTVKNPNFGYYLFEPSTVSFLYGGSRVGASRLGKGEVKLLTTATLSFGMDVRSNSLPEGRNTLIRDLNSGILKLSASGSVSGRMILWKIVNQSKTSNIDCSMTLVLRTKTINDLVCR